MPIPLLFIGLGAATGAFGVGKSIKAGFDQSEANKTNEQADEIVTNASKKLDIFRKNCGAAIDSLRKRKIQILDGNMKLFIQEFERLNHVELSESTGLNELQKMVLDMTYLLVKSSVAL